MFSTDLGWIAWPILGCLAAILYWLAWIVHARYFHHFADVPGPFWASISRAWLMCQIFRGDLEKTMRELHKRHGPIVRLNPDEVSIATPSAITKLYGIGKPTFHKTDFYLPLRSNISTYPDHLTNLDPAQQAERKRLVSSLYTTSSVLESECYITTCVGALVEQLRVAARCQTRLDLADWMQFFTFDAIGELYFGAPFGFLASGSDRNGWIHALDTLFPIFIAACAAPRSTRWLMPMVAVLSGRMRAALRAFDTMVCAAKNCVAEREQKMRSGEVLGRADLLAKLFDIKAAREKSDDFGLAEVEQEAFVAIFAGSDTTAIALRSILYYLMKDPRAYRKLCDEIDKAVAEGRLLKEGDGGFIRYGDAVHLPYLSACCKEGMRLHPSVGMNMPRHVPEGGCSIAGRYFGQGDRVGMNAAVAHYDPEVFGDDADCFRPERWLDGKKDPKVMDRCMLHFSAGSRSCLGKNIALVEIYKLVPQLMWEFDMELELPERGWLTSNAFLNKQTEIWVKLRERRALSEL